MRVRRSAAWSTLACVLFWSCAGEDGKEGPAGAQGATGPRGEAGPAGAQGPAGPKGDQGPAGPQGPAGTNGTNGVDGTNGTNGINGTNGVDGTDGTNGVDGTNGTDGTDGRSCWDLDGNGAADLATEDFNADGIVDVLDCRGFDAGYVPLAPNGLVGFVHDTAHDPVVGATVYLVPTLDIPVAPLALTDIAVERASTQDEPLEDTIALNAASYTKAVTDANGFYRIATINAGSYFVTVVPADPQHLPGGSLCRSAMAQSELVGQQYDIEVSTTPSADAEYVGPSVCLNCHGFVHETQTAHNLGIREVGKAGPIQDLRRFPSWDSPLAKFSTAGTRLYFYAYNGNTASPDWKVSETNPGSGVSFTALLFSAGDDYFVELTDVKGTTPTTTYKVDLSYGGGVFKQRYVTNIGGSRYILPIQYNFEGQSDETQPSSRWIWAQYNAHYCTTRQFRASSLLLSPSPSTRTAQAVTSPASL